jgi:membrane protein implicated in regulation of membrane protease activity
MVPAWLIWLIAAGVLAGAETLSMDFVLVMCAGGATAGAIAAGVGAPAAVQVIVAALVAVGLLAFIRPVARRHLIGEGAHPMGIEALIGMQAVVLSEVDAHHGLVRLNGGQWTARAFDGTQSMPAGTTVRVMEISGATAVVWEEP